MGLKEDKALYKKAKAAYYNEDAIMSDTEFDKLEDRIRASDPTWSELKATGVRVQNKKTEVELEEYMPSLGKFYPDRIDRWLAKYGSNPLWMDKLDGSSLQLIYDNGKPVRLITRGDGTLGGDISFLLPHLNVPRKISIKERTVFRCEAVMSEAKFKKWCKEFENARAMVNGLLNRKEPHKGLPDLDVVVLGVYGYDFPEGFASAEGLGFDVVAHGVLKGGASLSELLAHRKSISKYKMDGLVLVPRDRVFEYGSADKPKWIVAYKDNNEEAAAVQAVVKRIVWQTSRLKRIVPKIELEPVRLNDTTVTFATSHNAKWMIDRGIGPGAVVKILKSGEVIPKIVGVVKKGTIQLPEVAHKMQGVHFVATAVDSEIQVRRVLHFIKTLGIEFCGKSTIESLNRAGLTSSLHYLRAWACDEKDVFAIATGSKVMADKIWAEFDREFTRITMAQLMVASGCFDAGVGTRRLKAITDHCGQNILDQLVIMSDHGDTRGIESTLSEVPGFGAANIKLIIEGLPKFSKYLSHAKKYIKLVAPKAAVKKVTTSQQLAGTRVTFTGYRDDLQESAIEAAGGEVVSFGSKTTVLLYKAGGKKSSKIEKAEGKGISALTWQQFAKQFKL